MRRHCAVAMARRRFWDDSVGDDVFPAVSASVSRALRRHRAPCRRFPPGSGATFAISPISAVFEINYIADANQPGRRHSPSPITCRDRDPAARISSRLRAIASDWPPLGTDGIARACR